MKATRRNFVKLSGSAIALGCFRPLVGCSDDPIETTYESSIVGTPENTLPQEPAQLIVRDIGTFDYSPSDIQTVRPDIFREGHFSIFDVLNHLGERGDIDLVHHFDESLDTHVIESINGSENWWYNTWYDGGWPELSRHRVDYYPVKDGTYIEFMPVSDVEEADLDEFHATWRREVERKSASGGEIVIPLVEILFQNEVLTFEDVLVAPHHVRPDLFVDGVITAADAMLTLGNQNKFGYTLLWYETINDLRIKSYCFECFNGECNRHTGFCGFVYQVGDLENMSNPGSQYGATHGGNLIHLWPDARVINTPECIRFYWMCMTE